MRISTSRGRRELMAAALDCGISHYDVARLYGLGEAEKELGRFVAGRRSEVTIATKFGIEVSGRLAPLARFQAPARAFMERYPAVRNAVRRRDTAFYEPRRYDAGIAQRSLDVSLRSLGTDYVDILFIHDPTPTDDVDLAGLLEFFEDQRRAGKIRAWGVSQDAHPKLDIVGNLGPEAILQVRDDVIIRGEKELAPGRFTFGVMGQALTKIGATLQSDPAMRARWSERIGSDVLAPGFLAELLLADAFTANPVGTVIYSTLKTDRLPQAVAASRGERAEAVSALRELAATDRDRLAAQPL